MPTERTRADEQEAVFDLEPDAILKLERLAASRDPEVAHSDADDVLCDVLRKLGYFRMVDAYEAVPKWYA